MVVFPLAGLLGLVGFRRTRANSSASVDALRGGEGSTGTIKPWAPSVPSPCHGSSDVITVRPKCWGYWQMQRQRHCLSTWVSDGLRLTVSGSKEDPPNGVGFLGGAVPVGGERKGGSLGLRLPCSWGAAAPEAGAS